MERTGNGTGVGDGVDWGNADLENLERRLRAMLYAIWEVQGGRYKIVKIKSNYTAGKGEACGERSASGETVSK